MKSTPFKGSFLLLSFFISCNRYPAEVQSALKEIDDNRTDLKYVLDHYQSNPLDSLKFKAAVFLIKNMASHAYFTKDDQFDPAFNFIKTVPDGEFRRGIFEATLDSISKIIQPGKFKLVHDIETVNKDFLISNIELAFQEWSLLPITKRASFDEFCNYILPYRSQNEPLEKESRKHLLTKYKWAKNLLINNVPLKNVVDSVLRVAKFTTLPNINNYYAKSLSVVQSEKSRIGTCDDAVNYFVNLFRSLGVTCSGDYIPQWGNHHFSGHSWLYIKYGDVEYVTDIGGDGKDVREKYIGESIPKVYRVQYSKNNILDFKDKDVTAFYTPTTTLIFKKNNADTSLKMSINVFNSQRGWNPVQSAVKKNSNYIWKNIGVNVLYIIGTWKESKFEPYSYPFYINNNKEVTTFRPDTTHLIDANLLRKYPLATARNVTKLNWTNLLNDCTIEGSNDSDFINKKILYTIKGLKSTQIQKVQIQNKSRFGYLRLNSHQNDLFFARLLFYDAHGDTIKLKILPFKENEFPLSEPGSLTDNDPVSFFGGKKLSVGFSFSIINRPAIKSFEFQARNDGNQIQKDDLYELFYWDKYWRSFKLIKATNTVLRVNNLPVNSLFTLKNLSNGTEEHVFSINERGNQHWLGSLNQE